MDELEGALSTLLPNRDGRKTNRNPLSRAPTEIKALIASLVTLQDQAYQSMPDTDPARSSDCDDEGERRDWHGRGLNALFCVDREWNALAARHVFKVIGSSRCTESLFVFGIAVHHASAIETVVLDLSLGHPDDCRTLLNTLPRFNNLRRISVTGSTLSTFFGLGARGRHGPTADAEQRLHLTALLGAARRVPELTLDRVGLAQLASLLPQLDGVKVLRLNVVHRPSSADEGSDDSDDSDDPDDSDSDDEEERSELAWIALSQLVGVEVLSLDLPSWGLLRLVTDFQKPTLAFCTTLRVLRIRTTPSISTSSLSPFLETFAASLESLSITIHSLTASKLFRRLPGAGSKPNFPMLRKVELQGNWESIKDALTLLSPASLTNVALAIYNAETPSPFRSKSAITIIQQLLHLFPASLRQLALFNSDTSEGFFSSSSIAKAESFAVSHNIALTLGPRYNPFSSPPTRDTPSTLSEACGAIDETLRFGLAQSAHLRATKDYEGVQELIDLVWSLRGKMLRGRY